MGLKVLSQAQKKERENTLIIINVWKSNKCNKFRLPGTITGYGQ